VYATLTIVMCLIADPHACEVQDVRVDAVICRHATNVAEANLAEGYELRSCRCVPEMLRIDDRHTADNQPIGSSSPSTP
jgi:hypothetical protein